ncbi:MAG: HD domain-containing protein [Caldilinea sp.]|nr:HD domain-containing protein [Caldilineaceae bacterium]MCB9118581.1 HD domain-containing protein [Caldilineaceae bacterium]MCW5843489.1 HD domain-containing protein [Caldilinea sp.]
MNETTQQQVIDQTVAFVKERLPADPTGHDWWHTYRVWKNALHIGAEEQADLYVVQLAALLHDVADHKFHQGDDKLGAQVAAEWLTGLGVETAVVEHVSAIIAEMSFKGANVETAIRTREGMVVQDADRLDALGAIGIARAFAYGGYKQRLLHDPDVPPVLHDSFEQYKATKGPTINHFYEKLLLLKDRMNTAAGRRMAEQRHAILEEFLREFLAEWEGETTP